MRKTPYLIKNRFEIYYYRLVTPSLIRQLVPEFKKEVRISLQTKSLREANERCAYWHSGFAQMFRELQETGSLGVDDKYERNLYPSYVERSDRIKPEPETPEELAYALVEEDIKNRSYARHLFYLLERKGQLVQMVEDYKRLINPDFEFSKLKLDTPRNIEKVISIVELLQDPLLENKHSYLLRLPIKTERMQQYNPRPGVAKSAVW